MDHTSEYLAYNTAQYQAFNWNPLSYSSLPMSETYGLDYESAREATPRWFGVSFGYGNDGVSHTFLDYYVRTADPWLLAKVAVVASFKSAHKQAAADACEVEGEADYTISATIYDAGDVEGHPDACPSCGVRADSDDICECETGPAWFICDVFPADLSEHAVCVFGDDSGLELESDPFGRPAYVSLAEAFDESDLRLAAADG